MTPSICHTTSGVTGGGRGAECPPETYDREISSDLPGKERGKEKREYGEKKGKLRKGRWKIENVRRKKVPK